MRRAPDAVQFGTDPERALVLDGLTPPLRRMVSALDGTRLDAAVVADAVARGVAPGPARAVLAGLEAAGVISPTTVPRRPPSVLVRGGGRLAVALAVALAASGVDELGVVTTGHVRGDDTGTGLRSADIGRPAADAVADALARAGAPPPAIGRPDLVVLATGAAGDLARADDLRARGRAHLAVAVRDGVGLVGPLVVPGRGPCVRCAELARVDADPAWPSVLAELAHGPAPGVAAATVTAALAVAQILAPAATGHEGPVVLGGVLTIDPERAVLRRVAVTVHPACPCGSPSPVPAIPPADRPGRTSTRPLHAVTVARVA